MTEQEKREKAMIEKILSDEQIKIANDTNEFAKLQKLGISICYADALYDAGYRKEEEVQKETAKDIIYGVSNLVELIEPDEEVAKHIYYHLFEDCKEYGLNEKEFADRFGIEVGE